MSASPTRMKRHPITALAFAVVASLGLAACGSDDDSPGSERAGEHMEEMDHMGDHREASPVAEGAREVRIAARSFEFEPDEIHAKAGEDLKIVLNSEDILHDFVIDELDVHIAAEAKESQTGGVRADEPGMYTYYCSVPGHRSAGMEGTLVVEEG